MVYSPLPVEKLVGEVLPMAARQMDNRRGYIAGPG
jgi:hypothetical protein